MIKYLLILLLIVELNYSQIKISANQKLEKYIPESGLIIKIDGLSRRSVKQYDKIEYLQIHNQLVTPNEGMELEVYNGKINQWKRAKPNNNGWVVDSSLYGGYYYFNIESETERIVVFESMQNYMFYDNGYPRMGNIYQFQEQWEPWEPDFGFSFLPVKLKKGLNEFYFQCYGGKMKMTISDKKSDIEINNKDLTIPDVRLNEKETFFGGIVLLNNTTNEAKNLKIITEGKDFEKLETSVPKIQSLTIKKVKFDFRPIKTDKKGKLELKISVADSKGKILDSKVINISVKNGKETYKRTFISKIDGSVQYYAVNPPITESKEPIALFLGLHGAQVEGSNHASSYYNKNWGVIVSPTNRRPYGFNWEDWGREDALEVLALARKNFNIDPNRIYLTGHSMGGHGTWHIGGTFPDKFAAIGPSAGWISFWSYRFDDKYKSSNPVVDLINRTGNPSRTLMLANNYNQLGVYVIHGIDDDNVRIEQSYMMLDTLKVNHKDYVFHQEPDAGHWWDKSDDLGSDCVDWKPMFDFFARRSRPLNNRILNIDFSTASPGISHKNNWITIYEQEKYLEWSNVNITLEPGKNNFVGTTKNVKILGFDLNVINKNKKLSFDIDSCKITDIDANKYKDQIWLEKINNKWTLINKPNRINKGPHRYGLFKDSFKNNLVLVYGTIGTDEENLWSLNKAKYDAEQFWYQGNGSFDIVSDKEYSNSKYKDRNVVIYGNKNTNKAWKELLNHSPLQIENNKITIGQNSYEGDELVGLFTYPRKDSETASVVVVGATSIKGFRLTNLRPYLTPGYTLPDYTILNSNIVLGDDEAYLEAGFFDTNWSLNKAEIIKKK